MKQALEVILVLKAKKINNENSKHKETVKVITSVSAKKEQQPKVYKNQTLPQLGLQDEGMSLICGGTCLILLSAVCLLFTYHHNKVKQARM